MTSDILLGIRKFLQKNLTKTLLIDIVKKSIIYKERFMGKKALCGFYFSSVG